MASNNDQEQLYCYHCRAYHARTTMRRVATARGFRWRCLASLLARQVPVSERDAFGRKTTEENRTLAQRLARERFLATAHDPVGSADRGAGRWAWQLRR